MCFKCILYAMHIHRCRSFVFLFVVVVAFILFSLCSHFGASCHSVRTFAHTIIARIRSVTFWLCRTCSCCWHCLYEIAVVVVDVVVVAVVAAAAVVDCSLPCCQYVNAAFLIIWMIFLALHLVVSVRFWHRTDKLYQFAAPCRVYVSVLIQFCASAFYRNRVVNVTKWILLRFGLLLSEPNRQNTECLFYGGQEKCSEHFTGHFNYC